MSTPTTTLTQRPEAEIVRDLAMAAMKMQSTFPSGPGFVVVPPGATVEQFFPPESPIRKAGTVKLRDAASFVAYFNRLKTEQALIYATLNPACFVAVLNDHFGAKDEDGPLVDDTRPGFKDLRAEFQVPASFEWKRWTSIDRKDMSQLELATFIEDNLPDIVSPSGDALMKLVLNFEASKGSSFRSAHRLQDGSVNFTWVDETNGNGNTVVPAEIGIAIPVFENDDTYPLTARFKYRIADGGKLLLRIELVRAHKVLEAAFRKVWSQIEKGCGQAPLLGTPE